MHLNFTVYPGHIIVVIKSDNTLKDSSEKKKKTFVATITVFQRINFLCLSNNIFNFKEVVENDE